MGSEARFWRKVGQGAPDACWLWTASVFGTGYKYGQFTVRTRTRQLHLYAHRVAWTLTHGEIPDGLNVCHRCDVPLCCNPTHLFLGTQADNLADARSKGRLRSATVSSSVRHTAESRPRLIRKQGQGAFR